MSLDASTLGDPKPIATRRFRQEQLDGRRLPDPGLAGHEDDLPIPIRGPLQHQRSSLSSRSRPTTSADGVGFAGDGETLEGLWGAEGSTRATNR
jgi:hypothetical protein